ncbi:hypothetical protein FRB94_014270 [Tulasnella sp. JGI-2019a]|nr:hypothetical protein FRB93_005379 [Tulasnella sp. JGI-2019a]KAG9014177.1 hypothetical protein FRB94_014270 [Tulasnella sp. JGI-2019a]
MQDQDTLNNVLQAAQVLLSLAPVPGLAAAAIAIQEVLKFVNNVTARRSECEALTGFAANVLTTINSSAKVREDSQMFMAIDAVTKAITEMKKDFAIWANYSRLTGYIQNSEIRDRIVLHRTGLNEALTIVGVRPRSSICVAPSTDGPALQLTQVLGQAEWNERFTEAHSKDQVLLQDINQKHDQTNKEIGELKQLLVTPNWMQRSDNEKEENRASVMQKLSHLRSQTGVLPPRDLIYEIQKTGDRPFHSGALYELWKGVWLDKYIVVLKVFRGKDLSDQKAEKAMERVNRQIDLWRTLKHENILPLYGIYYLNEGGRSDTCFVSPWMTNRDMMRYLKLLPNANRLKLIHDVAKGLRYLHNVGILHGALQGSNVLVDNDGNAVLSDFTLSKFMEPDAMISQTGSQSSLRCHTDVYSWAMTALQIVSGHEPYYKIRAIGQLVNAINSHITPKRSDYDYSAVLLKDDRLWDLLEACWRAEPEKRPSVDEVIGILEMLMPDYTVISSGVPQTATVTSPTTPQPHNPTSLPTVAPTFPAPVPTPAPTFPVPVTAPAPTFPVPVTVPIPSAPTVVHMLSPPEPTAQTIAMMRSASPAPSSAIVKPSKDEIPQGGSDARPKKSFKCIIQ